MELQLQFHPDPAPHPSSGKFVSDGSHGSNVHRKLPTRAVSNFVTVPVTLGRAVPF
jgi:hypothetical protein